MEIPFCFMRNKAKLGALVNQKSATCIAVTNVRKEVIIFIKIFGPFFYYYFLILL